MAADDIPEEWLEEFNARMSAEDVPHSRRPFLALMEWTRKRKCAIFGGSPAETKLFEWFYARSPADAHLVPDMYEGVFYFDSAFWAGRVPRIVGGRLKLNISEFIEMPALVRDKLFQSVKATEEYKGVWADWFDYSFGLDDNRFKTKEGQNQPFLAAAVQQLSSVVSLLRELPPNHKAMESSRMAVEMFLKAYLVINHGFTERQASTLRHKLDELLKAILALAPTSELRHLNGHLAFPEVGERYSGKLYTGNQLWQAYRTAIYVGACVARSMSTRNMRGEFGIIFQ